MRLFLWINFLQLILFLKEFQTLSQELGNTITLHVTNASIPIILPADVCTPTIPKSGSGHIHGIKTHTHCINIYSQENCVGPFIRYQSSTIFSYIYNLEAHRWNGADLVEDEHVQVGSIGPCLDKCDPSNWAGMGRDSGQVTLFKDEDYKGLPYNVRIGSECHRIPQEEDEDMDWDSIRFSGTNACILVYEDESCRGSSSQLRPGYPHLHDLWWYGYSSKARANTFKSISVCGWNCPITPFPERTPAPVPVTTASTTTQTEILPIKQEIVVPTNSAPVDVSLSVTSTEENEPSNSTSFPWLICTSVVLTLVIIVCVGIFIYKRFQKSPSSRFNVKYRLQADA